RSASHHQMKTWKPNQRVSIKPRVVHFDAQNRLFCLFPRVPGGVEVMVARWLSGRWFWLLVGAAGLVVVMLMAGPVWAASDDSVTSCVPNGGVGWFASLVLDATGFPVVAYYDVAGQDVKLLHCDDPRCGGEGESVTSPDTAGFVGRYASLVLDAN